MGETEAEECNNDPVSGTQLDILVSDECLRPPEIQILKWICFPEKEEGDSSSIWEELLYSIGKSKKKSNENQKCCREVRCKKEKLVCELYRFMKIIKENCRDIKRYVPAAEVGKFKHSTSSIEPTYVLAHMSAKLLQFEKQIKRLGCSQNDTCRLVNLIKNIQRTILLQFICGPRANETLAKTVRDIAFMECLLNNLGKVCHCHCESKQKRGLTSAAVVETCEKEVNTSRSLDEEVSVTVQKENKATSYELKCTRYSKERNPPSCKRWFYYYRKENGTKATEFESHKDNITYYYDVGQVNRSTSTSDIRFKGDILLPIEEKHLKHSSNQTDSYFTFDNVIEVTTMCVSYTHEKTINELDQLPKLTNYGVTNDIYTTDFQHTDREEVVKTYMDKTEGMNILAEANESNNKEGLTLIFNSDTTKPYPSTGYSSAIDSKIISLKQLIFHHAKKIATQFLHNYVRDQTNSK